MCMLLSHAAQKVASWLVIVLYNIVALNLIHKFCRWIGIHLAVESLGNLLYKPCVIGRCVVRNVVDECIGLFVVVRHNKGDLGWPNRHVLLRVDTEHHLCRLDYSHANPIFSYHCILLVKKKTLQRMDTQDTEAHILTSWVCSSPDVAQRRCSLRFSTCSSLRLR